MIYTPDSVWKCLVSLVFLCTECYMQCALDVLIMVKPRIKLFGFALS